MGTHFEEDQPELQELYAESKTAQWSLEVLPWRDVEPPDDVTARVAQATGAAAMCALSESLLRVTSRGVGTVDATTLPLVLSVETRDYARHVEFWRRVLELYGPTAILPWTWADCDAALQMEEQKDEVVTTMLCGVQPMLRALYACAVDSASPGFWSDAYTRLHADLDRHLRIVDKSIALLPDVAKEHIRMGFNASRALFNDLKLPGTGERPALAGPFHDAVGVLNAFLLRLS